MSSIHSEKTIDQKKDIRVCVWPGVLREMAVGVASLRRQLMALEQAPRPAGAEAPVGVAAVGYVQGGTEVLGLLDRLEQAQVRCFGEPHGAEVRCGCRGGRPAILVCGDDLLVLQAVLEQSVNAGVDVYTQGEMLSGHYYPELRKYPQLYGHFEAAGGLRHFRGAVLMSGGCRLSSRLFGSEACLFRCGAVSGVESVAYDVSGVVQAAGKCPAPVAHTVAPICGVGNGPGVMQWQEIILEALVAGRLRHCFLLAGGGGGASAYVADLLAALPEGCLVAATGCAGGREYQGRRRAGGSPPLWLDIGSSGESLGLALLARGLRLGWKRQRGGVPPLSVILVWQGERAAALLPALRLLGVEEFWVTPEVSSSLRLAVPGHHPLLQYFGGRLAAGAAADLEAMLSPSRRAASVKVP